MSRIFAALCLIVGLGGCAVAPAGPYHGPVVVGHVGIYSPPVYVAPVVIYRPPTYPLYRFYHEGRYGHRHYYHRH